MKWQRNILPWDLEWQWIQKTAKRRTSQGTLLKTCFATAVYDIWIERKTQVYQNRAKSMERMLHDLKTAIFIRVRGIRRMFAFI